MKVQIRNGIPLTQGIRLIKDVLPNKVSHDLDHFIYWMEQGETISATLQKLQFPKTYVSFITIGESHGDLALAFEQCESYYQQKYQFKNTVRNAVSYPIFLLLLIILLFLFFTTILLPQFLQLYVTLQIEIPSTTRLIFTIFKWFHDYKLWILLSASVSFIVIYYLLRKKVYHKKIKLWMLHFPGLKKYWLQKYTFLFSSNLSLFLNHGISLMTGINILSESNEILVQEASKRIKKSLYEGESLSETIVKENIFLPSFFEMVRFYESVGSLDIGMKQYAEELQKQIESELKRKLKWLEPILISLTGVFVFVLIYILFSPIFSLIQSI
ncbi:type II secretory pathway component PulF [Tepidibacillus fermentans]|uniref:Type II secretory pathway component PulF n=2 Tax=Tepidibacillus fermentans TaxID=1281767 RepID=A0A4R3KJW6_9BACI|nr:type II secretory pathway component PulF [Tepidibacillus fermentans]